MKIGFDAKRAFFNRSGLGNYSRNTLDILAKYFPMNEYLLYTPFPNSKLYFYNPSCQQLRFPTKKIHNLIPFYWRSYKLHEDLINDKIELFHGLSNELPFNIHKTNIPTVVTIHDLIFMRYPRFYKYLDRKIYEKKFQYASTHASKIIAISKQTAEDIVQFFNVPENKIEVIYQSCLPAFWEQVDTFRKKEVQMKYLIPNKYILYVGNIEERKNILNIIKAIHRAKINYPFVIVGRTSRYMSIVKAYIENYNLKNIYFLQNVPSEDLPAIYQMAELFVYPSFFEGFGIPILEALVSKVPVITSKGGCFAEAGGKSTIYVDPYNPHEIGEAINAVLKNPILKENMIVDGYMHAQKFRHEVIAQQLIKVYELFI